MHLSRTLNATNVVGREHLAGNFSVLSLPRGPSAFGGRATFSVCVPEAQVSPRRHWRGDAPGVEVEGSVEGPVAGRSVISECPQWDGMLAAWASSWLTTPEDPGQGAGGRKRC